MSGGPKPEARQAPRERNMPKAPTGNSSSVTAERPQRRRDNGDRREGADKGERRDRPERHERPRRSPAGRAAAAERSKLSIEEKAHGPVVHVKGDIASGSTWAKNGSGPSFADMVRQRNNARAEGCAAKGASPPQKELQSHVQTPPPEPSQPQLQPQPEPEPAQPDSVPEPQPAQPEESSEEEVVINTVQAPAVVEMEPIPEPPAPVALVIAPHYVLEIERVVSVKLPPRVTHTAETQRGLYMFSAQAGKPPTPPPTVQQHAVYRPDTANLGTRQWSLGTDSRIQQPPQQQQAWPSASQFDYWNNASERVPASRPFMGTQAQTPYNSYPSTVPLSHQRAAGNAFPVRFRSTEVPESALRQQSAVPFNRASQQTNGGGVW
ncbi:hypothetical protein LSCM1_06188 [Leishmania martiniquensis]|uniref:Uncharacterized protein n=1 Tax=Leishmania martiniquensis TaxID=1580590 RepID=A0A836KRX5_9TRYP|nr:hypothetical protein LSCM1_06188 [Leishmania martiniquensis]